MIVKLYSYPWSVQMQTCVLIHVLIQHCRTCGPVVHGAFQAGHKLARCKVNVILRSFYKLFKDSPARRADYQKIIGIKLFPLKILFHKMD